MKKAKKKNIILWALIFLPYLLLIPAALWYFNKLNHIEHSSFIVINKAEMTLYHYDYKGSLLQKSSIATGKNFGNKEIIGDGKTPEGVFRILQVEDASSWTHDFKDDTLGPISAAYGPYFIRLDVPGQKGIGIHGTHDNNSIGSRASEGCIRMQNKDLIQLVNNLKTASVVVITPGVEDIKVDRKEIDTVLSKLALKGKTQKSNNATLQKEIRPKKAVKLQLKDKNKK